MNIVIVNRQRMKKIEARLLKRIAEALFAELKISKAKLGINLVAAPEMALLNETFLKHTGSTDVITFDYADKTEGTILRGEIFVCVDEAIIHAKKFKTNWQSEIVRYIVHGVLHLIGHDDLKPKRRREDEARRELFVAQAFQKVFARANRGAVLKFRA